MAEDTIRYRLMPNIDDLFDEKQKFKVTTNNLATITNALCNNCLLWLAERNPTKEEYENNYFVMCKTCRSVLESLKLIVITKEKVQKKPRNRITGLFGSSPHFEATADNATNIFTTTGAPPTVFHDWMVADDNTR